MYLVRTAKVATIKTVLKKYTNIFLILRPDKRCEVSKYLKHITLKFKKEFEIFRILDCPLPY